MTFRTFLKIVLAYMTALVADGVRNVECEVVASFLCSHTKKLSILCLRKMLFKVKMKSRATGKMFDILPSMQTHLVDYIE